MAPKEPPTPTPAADPDEEFFKTHGVEEDGDKQYLKSAYLREKYLDHKRKLDADEEKKSKGGSKGGKGLFGRGRE